MDESSSEENYAFENSPDIVIISKKGFPEGDLKPIIIVDDSYDTENNITMSKLDINNTMSQIDDLDSFLNDFV